MALIDKQCRLCKKIHYLDVRESDLLRFNQGEQIQDVMPYLSADERELFISGVCGKCFDQIFADAFGDEEEEE